jgi:hypothetical protein
MKTKHIQVSNLNFYGCIILIVLFNCTLLNAQNYFWGNSSGGTGIDYPGDVALDAAGNVYQIGIFEGTADMQGGAGVLNLTSNGGNDIFINKYNSSGTLLWAKSLGGTDDDGSLVIEIDNDGNIFACGTFRISIDLDPNAGVQNFVSNGSSDVFILKLDANGNFIWAKKFGGTTADNVSGLAIDANNELYLTGTFSTTVDFDPGPANNSLTNMVGTDAFVLKLDALGNFVWVKGILGLGYDRSSDIGVDDAGNVYVGGYFNDLLDLDPSATLNTVNAYGADDIFLVKLDNLGNFVWGHRIGNSDSNLLISMYVDNSGNVYGSGYYYGALDFDPGPNTFVLTDQGYWDGFLFKLNANGEFQWANTIGGTDYADVRKIKANMDGNVFITGHFYGTANFNDAGTAYNLTSVGAGDDAFCAAYNPTGTMIWAVRFGSSGNDGGEQLAVDDLGNVYASGYHLNTIDLNPQSGTNNFPTAGQEDVFMVKLGPCINPGSLGTISGVNTFCTAQTANFSVAALADATGYTWSVPAGWQIISGQNTNSITVTTGNNSGNVSVFATSPCGSGPISNVAVNVNANPQIQITATPSSILCTGQSVTLNSTGAISYTYSNGISNGVAFTPSTSGNYSVTGIDANGCSGSTAIFITVNSLPNVGIQANPGTLICAGQLLTLSGTGAQNYIWNNSITNGVAFIPSTSQTYEVTGTDANGCSNTATTNIMINFDAVISQQPINDTALINTNAMFVIANSGPGGSFQWQQNNGTGFVNLSNFGAYSGVNNDTLLISNVNLTMDNFGYRCIVNAGACADTSDFALLKVTEFTGMGSLNTSAIFEVFPNPFASNINLKVSPSEAGKDLIIYDMQGNILRKHQITQSNEVLNLTEISAGIYFIQINGSTASPIKLFKLN